MKIAKLRQTDGRVEQKTFTGVPKPRIFAYKKGDNGNVIGRLYFDIDPGQDLKSNIITYSETDAPKPQ